MRARTFLLQLRALRVLRSHPLMAEGSYSVQDAGNGMLRATYTLGQRRLMGVFSTRGASAPVRALFGWPLLRPGEQPARGCGWKAACSA